MDNRTSNTLSMEDVRPLFESNDVAIDLDCQIFTDALADLAASFTNKDVEHLAWEDASKS